MQELPETSHLIDVGVRRREGGAVNNTEEFQNEREGRGGGEFGGGEGGAVRECMTRFGNVLESEIPARTKKIFR